MPLLQYIAHHLGYSEAFLTLGLISSFSVFFFVIFFRETRPNGVSQAESAPIRSQDSAAINYAAQDVEEDWIDVTTARDGRKGKATKGPGEEEPML